MRIPAQSDAFAHHTGSNSRTSFLEAYATRGDTAAADQSHALLEYQFAD